MITSSNIETAVRAERRKEIAIFARANRKSPILAAFVAAGLASIAILEPAGAANPRPPTHTAPVKATLAACDRTAGCSYRTYSNGVTVGCSPTVCFACNTKVCAANRPKGGQHPAGHLPVGEADTLKSLPPAVPMARASASAVAGIPHGVIRPVVVERVPVHFGTHRH